MEILARNFKWTDFCLQTEKLQRYMKISYRIDKNIMIILRLLVPYWEHIWLPVWTAH